MRCPSVSAYARAMRCPVLRSGMEKAYLNALFDEDETLDDLSGQVRTRTANVRCPNDNVSCSDDNVRCLTV
eukprot:1469286-Rhodomonas_salina.1